MYVRHVCLHTGMHTAVLDMDIAVVNSQPEARNVQILERRRQTQRHRDTETQRHRDTETQRHRDTETQRHRDTETQRHRGTEAQRHRGTEAQRHRDTETHTHTHTLDTEQCRKGCASLTYSVKEIKRSKCSVRLSIGSCYFIRYCDPRCEKAKAL